MPSVRDDDDDDDDLQAALRSSLEDVRAHDYERSQYEATLERSRAEARAEARAAEALQRPAAFAFPAPPSAPVPSVGPLDFPSAPTSTLPEVLGGDLDRVRRESRERPPEPPDAFICPISFELMVDPVMCSDGHTYERDAIEDWLSSHNTSPKTNEELQTSALFPNHNLRAAIEEWQNEHIEATPPRQSHGPA